MMPIGYVDSEPDLLVALCPSCWRPAVFRLIWGARHCACCGHVTDLYTLRAYRAYSEG